MTAARKLKVIINELLISIREAEFNRQQSATAGDGKRADMWSARVNALDGFRLRAERIMRGPEKDE